MGSTVEMLNQYQTTPAPASRCGSQASSQQSENSRSSRPGTPQRFISSLAKRFSASGFPGSGSLSRTPSLKSFKSSSRSESKSAQLPDTQQPLKLKKSSSSDVSQTRPMTAPARNAVITPTPAALTREKTLRGPRSFPITSPSVTVEPPLEPESTLGAASPGVESTSSTLSVDTDDLSTRSPSLAGDMTDSQATASSTSTVYEDLPEGLRLMRVAQSKGVKVLDFAFEGSKKEGVIEDWAWEGGAACKGFGIGIGGGAYNGILKKYRPPPKDTNDDDKMDIDTPPSTQSRATAPRPASMVAGIGGRPLDFGPTHHHHHSHSHTHAHGQARPQSQYHLQPRPQSAIHLSESKTPVSQSVLMDYLNQRKPQMQEFQELRSNSIKRERSANSQEPSDCSPFKIQKRTYN